LTSLTEDIAAIQRVVGPVVLVGHAYGGAVIAGATDDRVRSPVYVAALAPAEGETVADVIYRAKLHPEAPKLSPDAHGLIWMPEAGFAKAVAHKASSDQTTILEAVQRPIAVKCIQEKAPLLAWKTKPLWFLLAEQDRMIAPGDAAIYRGADGRKDSDTPGRSQPRVHGDRFRHRRDSASGSRDARVLGRHNANQIRWHRDWREPGHRPYYRVRLARDF
jgi:pimeloyl-ACP methyl ester carboxylesterase